jgi:hypothetical protein
MKLTTGIVALALTAGMALAQTPAATPNTKSVAQGAQPQSASPSTAHSKPSGAVPAKPSVGAQVAKPAVISISPVAVPAKAAPAPAKTASTPAKPAIVPAKATPTTAKPVVVPVKTTAAPAKPAMVPAKTATTPAKPEVKVPSKTATAPAKQQAAAPVKTSTKQATKVAAAPASALKDTNTASSDKESAKDEKQEDKKYSMTGKRDPFISPVVNRSGGSGCSTGKKCLDIDQIALHGVVKSDNGMIAVVTNGLNKAYFLRENDPVFNGYVVKITGDSIVFKQTLQDRLGKSFTKDVVKRILTPAV